MRETENLKEKYEEETKFFYTLSSRGEMVQKIFYSIVSLTNYVEPQNIKVVFTPPILEEDVEKIQELGVEVEEKDHAVNKMFRKNGYDDLKSYGDKLWLTEERAENIVFLDCDTLIMGDIWKVLEGDFDFKARPANEKLKGWKNLFEANNEPLMDWMPNAGFLVFKQSTHRNISEKWRQYYLEIDDRSYNESGTIYREQYALALAVSSLKKQKMTSLEHRMDWADSPNTEGILYHYSDPTWSYKRHMKEFYKATRNLSLIEALRKRIK